MSDEFCCPLCDKRFETDRGLRMHISRSHKPPEEEEANPTTNHSPVTPNGPEKIAENEESSPPPQSENEVADAFDLTSSLYAPAQPQTQIPHIPQKQRLMIDGGIDVLSPGRQKKQKRPARLRHITAPIRDRIESTLAQRMCLLSRRDVAQMDSYFQVFCPSTGFGEVHITIIPTCTCPDFEKGDVCTHLLFVFIRVLKVPKDDNVIAQRGFLDSEITEIFARAPPPPMAPSQRDLDAGDAQQPVLRVAIDQECPICFNYMSPVEDLIWCETSCGCSTHTYCFNVFSNHHQNEGKEVNCPWCHRRWGAMGKGHLIHAGQHEIVEEQGRVAAGQAVLSAPKDTSEDEAVNQGSETTEGVEEVGRDRDKMSLMSPGTCGRLVLLSRTTAPNIRGGASPNEQGRRHAALGLTESVLFFHLEATVPDGSETERFEFSMRFTVDKIKTVLFEKMESLKGLNKRDYILCLNDDNCLERLEVEFLKFPRSHAKIEELILSEQIIPITIASKMMIKQPIGRLGPPSRFARQEPIVNVTLTHHLDVARSSNDLPYVSPPETRTAGDLSIPKVTSPISPGMRRADRPLPILRSPILLATARSISSSSYSPFMSMRNSPVSVTVTSPESPSSGWVRPQINTSNTPLGLLRPPRQDGSPIREHAETIRPKANTEPSIILLPDGSDLSTRKMTNDQNQFIGRRMAHTKGVVDEEEEEVSVYDIKTVHVNGENNRSLRPSINSKTFTKMEIKAQCELSEVTLTPNLETFSIEKSSGTTPDNNASVIFIEGEETNTPYYGINFVSKDHLNVVATHNQFGPVIISAKKYGDDWAGDTRRKFELPKKCKKNLTPKQLLQLLYPNNYNEFYDIKHIKDPKFERELELYERRQLISSYKFGILYCAADQTKEEDMFTNCGGSEDFIEFLELLGEKVQLQGWTKYRAGLDVKTNSTGVYSVYTTFDGKYEIMYHVSTLLPFYPNDIQQLERKRHLGNDIVVIIFKEGEQPYVVDSTIKSEFNHVYCIVQKLRSGDSTTTYKVTFARKEGVPNFGPPLPKESLFEKNDDFRHWLLTKLINAERASYQAAGFKYKIERTKQELLTQLVSSFNPK
ncbi:hypothetical protein PROFUN_11876 [Planoprotostelium fungivorum]|uniref:Uncharacterized protein n=1 Tax=Planoprotostelium fungivorum TaxID=1890364 RepID=A0A2P6N9D3_9EUKA|nr:hypothetical protein PROFUN_11876 [Planoprotostelium fungivorum]